MKLIDRIMAVVKKALAENDALNKGTYGNFDAWDHRQKEIEKEVAEIDKEAGKGLVVGRILSFGVADGAACYLITKVRKHDVVVEWVPMYDGYFSDAVWLSKDKRHYIVNRGKAEQNIRWTDTFR